LYPARVLLKLRQAVNSRVVQGDQSSTLACSVTSIVTHHCSRCLALFATGQSTSAQQERVGWTHWQMGREKKR